jgi:hypothetical protein
VANSSTAFAIGEITGAASGAVPRSARPAASVATGVPGRLGVVVSVALPHQ